MNANLLAMILVLTIIIVACCMNYLNITVVSGSGVEVDAVAKVYRVIDGDTFDAFPVGRVRLADVNAPERGEEGF